MLFIGAIISSAIGGITNIIGGGFSLAATKRAGEDAEDYLRAQGEIQHQGFLDQMSLMEENQENTAESSDRMIKNALKLVAVLALIGITAGIVWRLAKSAVPAAK